MMYTFCENYVLDNENNKIELIGFDHIIEMCYHGRMSITGEVIGDKLKVIGVRTLKDFRNNIPFEDKNFKILSDGKDVLYL